MELWTRGIQHVWKYNAVEIQSRGKPSHKILGCPKSPVTDLAMLTFLL